MTSCMCSFGSVCRVGAVQQLLASLTGISAKEQILMSEGVPLEASKPLAAYQLPMVNVTCCNHASFGAFQKLLDPIFAMNIAQAYQ